MKQLPLNSIYGLSQIVREPSTKTSIDHGSSSVFKVNNPVSLAISKFTKFFFHLRKFVHLLQMWQDMKQTSKNKHWTIKWIIHSNFISGGDPNKVCKLNIMNMNKQTKLFSQGMHPVIRVGETGKWERTKHSPVYHVSVVSVAFEFDSLCISNALIISLDFVTCVNCLSHWHWIHYSHPSFTCRLTRCSLSLSPSIFYFYCRWMITNLF